MLKLFHWLLAIYITIECFACFERMDRGDKLCRLAKYAISVATVYVGLALCYITASEIWPILWVLPDLAIALFLWPTTYARFNGGFKNRIGD